MFISAIAFLVNELKVRFKIEIFPIGSILTGRKRRSKRLFWKIVLFMDTSNNNLKRPISELAQSKINQEFKRLKVGDQFYDHDWNCLNENSVWSGVILYDENLFVTSVLSLSA